MNLIKTFLSISLLISSQHTLSEEVCNRPKVKITTNVGKPIFDYSKTVKDITTTVNGPGSKLYTVGLTSYYAEPSFIIKARKEAKQTTADIDVHLDIKDITIYIAKEFQNSTCEKKFIHDHELRHVESYKTHLFKVSKELEKEMARRFTNCYKESRDSVQIKLAYHLNGDWAPIVKKMMNDTSEFDKLIDSSEEYERLQLACNGKIMNGFDKY